MDTLTSPTAAVLDAAERCPGKTEHALRLKPGDVRAFDGATTAVIRCVAGSVWATQEGNPSDILLSPGQRFVAARHGKIVVQALDETACIEVVACAPS